MTTRRGVGGAAQGSITPSPSSSLGVSIPFNDKTQIWRLRGMLRTRDREIESMRYVKGWYGHYPEKFKKLDEERRLIRLRIKQLSFERKQEKRNEG